jgi:hypothetical protein
MARAHPALRQDAVSQMCRALIADQRIAQIVVSAGNASMQAEPSIVRGRVGWWRDYARQGAPPTCRGSGSPPSTRPVPPGPPR